MKFIFPNINNYNFYNGKTDFSIMRLYEISQKMWHEPFVDGKQPIFYHGTKVKFDRFDPNFASQDSSIDQNGPGFYFTTNKDEATHFAGADGVVLECILTPRKLIKSRGVVSLGMVRILMKNAPDLDDYLTNWMDNSEDQKLAFKKAMDAFVVYNDPKETYERIWGDLYMRGHSREYMALMSKHGYDGVLVSNGLTKHVIMLNEKKIKIIGRINFSS